MKNILFVSIAFPPKSDAEGLQVAKYLKYLLRETAGRFNVDAVTSSQPTLNMTYDASLESASVGVRDLVEVPIYENRYTNYLLRKLVPRVASSPDPKFSFHLQADRVARRLEHKPDLIYSRSFPTSSAVMAHKLKKHFGVPWVMHLSDLWADCPEMSYSGATMAYQQRVEAACFAAADVVCVTSIKTLEFYRKKYGKKGVRLEYYPNVFDPEDVPLQKVTPGRAANGKLRIVHTGSLAGDRSPEPFLKAIAGLSPEMRRGLEIVFVGAIDARNRAVFAHYDLDCVSDIGVVPYRSALEIQRSADILLLIDMPVEPLDRRVFFPSKVLDYMIARRPILALIDAGSEVQRVIETHGLGACIERHDQGAIRDYLERMLEGRGDVNFRDEGPVAEFDAATNARRLCSLFEEYA